MLRRIGKVFVVAALVLATGLHWATLQTVAWTTMLADNLCNQSLTQAVSQTFDGQHLCPLCRAIAAGKKAEQKSTAVASKLKMEYPPVAEKLGLMVAPTPVSALSLDRLSARSSFLKPPSPPPRGFFV